MIAMLLALLLAAPSAADNTPPEVEHTPLERAARGQPVQVTAKVRDPSGVHGASVFARAAGGKTFAAYPMDDSGDDRYVAELPQSILSKGSFEYYLEATDQAGNVVTVGSQKKPFKVVGFDPRPKAGKLMVRSEPAGADVFIDGVPQGKSPVTLLLNPGTHTVAVSAPGRREAEHILEVMAGRDLAVLVALSEGKGPGSLSVVSEPGGGHVSIDGERVGQTPYKGPLPAGVHRVAVEMEGRLRAEREVDLKEGRDVELSFSLPELPKEPALAVETEPAGATVSIDGKDRGRAPWIGPLSAGPHQVLVRMEGHREVATDFTMPKGRDLSLRLVLPVAKPDQPPQVTVSSAPEGASVKIDGKEVGQTPWSGEVEAGQHKLTIALDGFVAQQKQIAVAANRDAEVAVALARKPGPAKVRVESDPPGADILVDGESKGAAPFEGQLSPGEHQVEAQKEGFRGVAQQIQVEAGQQISLRLALAPASKEPSPPQLSVRTQPAGAKVLLDGEEVGVTPLNAKGTAGQHEIKLSLDGYQPKTAKFTFPENRDVQLVLAVSLKPVREGQAVEAPNARALARSAFRRAQACFKQGEWACALAGYKQAYELQPVAALLFNIGQARRRNGDYKEAAEAYRSFAKETQDEKLKAEAERLAALSDEAASGAPVTGDEDAKPPVIKHAAIASAERGKPLRVSASIEDDRSGVFNQQICWRNIYAPEWECQPLVLVGTDEYGVEVPARAVADGFAYFLEAYDNAGNGPARSGAPELPHSVAIEDAPPAVPPSAVAEAPTVESTTPATTKQTLPPEVVKQQPTPEVKSGSKIPALVFVAGLVTAGAGGYFGWQANTIKTKDSVAVIEGQTIHSISAAEAKQHNDNAKMANTLWIGAAGLVVVAGVLHLILN